jgi:signal transduction histidine kinase
MLQELLSNVRKHSQASKVDIVLTRVIDGIQVEVADDGVGFVPEDVLGPQLSGEGIGLASVRERVQVAGGTFDVDSAPGAGTHVRIVLPPGAGRHITAPLDESRLLLRTQD